MNARISGLGLWLPPSIRTDAAWPSSFRAQYGARRRTDITRIVADRDPIGDIMARHAGPYEDDPFRGVLERRVAGDGPSSEAEEKAARAALDDAQLGPRDIDLVLGHSLVPDRLTPPNAPLVAHRLGLTRAAAFEVDAVCASFLAQLALASAMVESGRARHVLLVQSHLVSPTLDLEQPSSVLLGDAAAAAIVSPAREGFGVLGQVAASDGSLHAAITWQRRDGERAPWYRGGQVTPGSDDREAVRRLAGRLLHLGVETLAALFDGQRVAPAAIDVLATIQPFAWYPSALAEAAGVGAGRAPTTFPRIAHVGAAGVVANLLEARATGILGEGSLVALYAHGAGLNRFGALVRWGG